MKFFAIAAIAALAASVSAGYTATELGLVGVSQCVVDQMVPVVKDAGCEPTDRACICSKFAQNKSLQDKAKHAVLKKCTLHDGLQALKATKNLCPGS